MRRNLVVVRAGTRSEHVGWAGPARNFDLLVCAYHPDAPSGAEDARILLPGRKVEGLSRLFRTYPGLLDRYERIALIDDDIQADPDALSKCFDIGETERLAIWQPALKPESYFSYAALLENRAFLLRYVNFVEMMCPFFRSDALRRALLLMNQGWETGIDTLWCRQFDQPRRQCAVIDAASIVHSRPVGIAKTENGFKADETYDQQVERFLAGKGRTFHGPVTYAGITLGGMEVKTRLGVFVRSLRLLGTVRRSPMRQILIYRLVLAHLRHMLTRPLNDSRAF